MRFYNRAPLTVALVCCIIPTLSLTAYGARSGEATAAPVSTNRVLPPDPVNSANWSGAIDVSTVPFNDSYFGQADETSVTFTVPQYKLPDGAKTCPGQTTYLASIWGGIGGLQALQIHNTYGNPFLYQAGIQLEIDCSDTGAAPTYAPIGTWTEFVPQDQNGEVTVALSGGARNGAPDNSVIVGDIIEVSVLGYGNAETCSSDIYGPYCLHYAMYTITDNTTNASYSMIEDNNYIDGGSGSTDCTDPLDACFAWQSAEGIVERPTVKGFPQGDFLPLPDFGHVMFTSATFLTPGYYNVMYPTAYITKKFVYSGQTYFKTSKMILVDDLCDSTTTDVTDAAAGTYQVAYHFESNQYPLSCFVVEGPRRHRTRGVPVASLTRQMH